MLLIFSPFKVNNLVWQHNESLSWAFWIWGLTTIWKTVKLTFKYHPDMLPCLKLACSNEQFSAQASFIEYFVLKNSSTSFRFCNHDSHEFICLAVSVALQTPRFSWIWSSLGSKGYLCSCLWNTQFRLWSSGFDGGRWAAGYASEPAFTSAMAYS